MARLAPLALAALGVAGCPRREEPPPRPPPAPAAAPAAAEREAEALVRALRALREAGKLNEAQRRTGCAGGDTQRLAWFDGWGKARRLSRTGPLPAGLGEGEATRDHYYDGEGGLRLVVVDGTGPGGRFRRRIVLDGAGRRALEDPAGVPPWPEADLVAREAGDAFWAACPR